MVDVEEFPASNAVTVGGFIDYDYLSGRLPASSTCIA